MIIASINNIIMIKEIPQDPTMIWALMFAVATLSGVIVYLHKSMEKQREGEIKSLLSHKADIQHLLEKTLSAFNEVERKIVDTDTNNRIEIKDTIFRNGKEITNEMEKILRNNG